MARASYLISARAMARGATPLAGFCAATWPVFTPPLTVGAEDGLLGPGSMAQIRQAGIDLLGRDLDKPDAALLQALGIGSPEGLLLCADAG
jgi:hypothetical protein